MESNKFLKCIKKMNLPEGKVHVDKKLFKSKGKFHLLPYSISKKNLLDTIGFSMVLGVFRYSREKDLDSNRKNVAIETDNTAKFHKRKEKFVAPDGSFWNSRQAYETYMKNQDDYYYDEDYYNNYYEGWYDDDYHYSDDYDDDYYFEGNYEKDSYGGYYGGDGFYHHVTGVYKTREDYLEQAKKKAEKVQQDANFNILNQE